MNKTVRTENLIIRNTVSEFNEFDPRLKSAKNWFQLNAGFIS